MGFSFHAIRLAFTHASQNDILRNGFDKTEAKERCCLTAGDDIGLTRYQLTRGGIDRQRLKQGAAEIRERVKGAIRHTAKTGHIDEAGTSDASLNVAGGAGVLIEDGTQPTCGVFTIGEFFETIGEGGQQVGGQIWQRIAGTWRHGIGCHEAVRRTWTLSRELLLSGTSRLTMLWWC